MIPHTIKKEPFRTIKTNTPNSKTKCFNNTFKPVYKPYTTNSKTLHNKENTNKVKTDQTKKIKSLIIMFPKGKDSFWEDRDS